MVITRTLCLVALALITSAAVINVRSVPAKPKTKMPLLMFDCLEMPGTPQLRSESLAHCTDLYL